jgi:hypothetical protein
LQGCGKDVLSQSRPQLTHSHSTQAETSKSEITHISAPIEIWSEVKEVDAKKSQGRKIKKRKARNTVLTILDDDNSTNDDEGFDEKQQQVKHDNFYFIDIKF